MTRLRLDTHPDCVDVVAVCAAGRRFNLYAHADGGGSTLVLARDADLRELDLWIAAWANYGPRKTQLYRLFVVTGVDTERFHTAFIVEGGAGAAGLSRHDDVRIPDRFF